MTFLAVLFGVFVLAYLTIGLLVVRRPLIGRIALREASRRPSQTAVLVLGLMIAGAAIFSVQVIFDSMYETNRAQVLKSWGRDDIEVSAGGGYFDGGLAQRRLIGPPSPAIQPWSPRPLQLDPSFTWRPTTARFRSARWPQSQPPT